MAKAKVSPQFAGLIGGDKPLVTPNNKLKPLKQIYAVYEIEKRYVVITKEEDHSKNKNGLETYNLVLEQGTKIRQGYIKDIQKAKEILDELGIELDFRPNTIRFRQYGKKFILTVKDRAETKKREVEWKLTRAQFNKYWPLTIGARIEKKRYVKKIKGFDVEIDAFTDRFLCIAEIEVDDEKMLPKTPKLGMDVTGDNKWTNKTLSK